MTSIWAFRKKIDQYDDLNEEEYFLKHIDVWNFIKSEIEKDNSAKKILDVGCCTGIGYKDFKYFDRLSISGLDINKKFIEIAKLRGIDGHICDVSKEKFPYENSVFDVVILGSLIEHTLNPRHLISESKRVLKGGGRLIISTPNAVSLRSRIDLVRGKNQFSPLIQNIFSKDYLLRCSIFYSKKEIAYILGDDFSIERVAYINDKKNNPSTIRKLVNCLCIIPSLKDVIIVVAKKHITI